MCECLCVYLVVGGCVCATRYFCRPEKKKSAPIYNEVFRSLIFVCLNGNGVDAVCVSVCVYIWLWVCGCVCARYPIFLSPEKKKSAPIYNELFRSMICVCLNGNGVDAVCVSACIFGFGCVGVCVRATRYFCRPKKRRARLFITNCSVV